MSKHSTVVAAIAFGAALFAVAPASAVDAFAVTSPAVPNGGTLPKAFTCDGDSLSPPLAWSGAPEGTKSFAVLMDHIAPDGIHWYWIAYAIPPGTVGLPQANKDIGLAAGNSVNRQLAYAPPCSQGLGMKTYTITVFALGDMPDGAAVPRISRTDFLARIAGHVLAEARLSFSYSR